MYYEKQQSHTGLDPKHSVRSIISVELNVILCFTAFGQFKWRVELYGQGYTVGLVLRFDHTVLFVF